MLRWVMDLELLMPLHKSSSELQWLTLRETKFSSEASFLPIVIQSLDLTIVKTTEEVRLGRLFTAVGSSLNRSLVTTCKMALGLLIS